MTQPDACPGTCCWSSPVWLWLAGGLDRCGPPCWRWQHRRPTSRSFPGLAGLHPRGGGPGRCGRCVSRPEVGAAGRVWRVAVAVATGPPELANRLRRGDLPEAWIAPPEIRGLRELVRYRALCRHRDKAPCAEDRIMPMLVLEPAPRRRSARAVRHTPEPRSDPFPSPVEGRRGEAHGTRSCTRCAGGLRGGLPPAAVRSGLHGGLGSPFDPSDGSFEPLDGRGGTRAA
jgi:hypothetical protein